MRMDIAQLQAMIKMLQLQGQSPLGNGLRGAMPSQPGIAPFGQRFDGSGVKGMGYYGAVPSAGGMSTEISSGMGSGLGAREYPLMVPGLTAQEMAHLMGGGDPTPEIQAKAQAHAQQMMGGGQSPFAGGQGLRYPVPK